MKTTKYLIIKEGKDNYSEIEEIETNDIDVVLARASELMKSTDFQIHIWEKNDYVRYKQRERDFE